MSMTRQLRWLVTFAFTLAALAVSRDLRGQEHARPEEKKEKPKVSQLEAMEQATRAVPQSRVVRLELNGDAYVVVVVAGKGLLELEINAATGKASDTKPAEMDADEFKDAESASKAIAAARISLA